MNYTRSVYILISKVQINRNSISTDDMASWVRELNHDGQLRWIGPEKGLLSLAIAGIINAFWDLWGKMERKPVWKLIVDMTPEKIVSLIDFRYNVRPPYSRSNLLLTRII